MEEWLELMRWALLLLGWVYLIAEAAIASSFRTAFVAAFTGKSGGRRGLALTLVYCHPCVAFWVGAALGALHLWPFDVGYWAIGESAFAAMAVAHTWSAFKGGNFAYAVEQPEGSDDGTTEEEDG